MHAWPAFTFALLTFLASFLLDGGAYPCLAVAAPFAPAAILPGVVANEAGWDDVAPVGVPGLHRLLDADAECVAAVSE